MRRRKHALLFLPSRTDLDGPLPFLQELLRPETLQTHNGLLEHLRRFLDPSVDEKDRVCCDYGKTPNVAVKAVKSVGHAAIAAPGAIIHTVGNVVGDVVDGTLGKAFSVRIHLYSRNRIQ